MERLIELSRGWVVMEDRGEEGEGVVRSSISSGSEVVLQQGRVCAIVFHCDKIDTFRHLLW